MQDVNKIKLIKIIGKTIRTKRMAQKKTIYRISAESSLSKSTWREVEIGACKDINLSTLWKISEGLDITIVDLFTEVMQKIEQDFTLID